MIYKYISQVETCKFLKFTDKFTVTDSINESN